MEAFSRAGVIIAVFVALLAGFAVRVQQSIVGPSGFGYATLPDDLVGNLTDQSYHAKVALVTGANSGIGWEISQVLASKGFHVIVMARTYPKAEEAIARIKESFLKRKLREPTLTPLACDLGSLIEIEAAVQSFEDLNLPLHLLINSAAERGSLTPRTVEGFELQMGVNYFGHMYLTSLLMPILLTSTPSRVVFVTSTIHRISTGAFLNYPSFEPPSESSLVKYADSKLALILATQNWHSRHYPDGVSFYAVSPGFSTEHLEGNIISLWQQQGTKAFVASMAMRKTPLHGSASVLYAALRAPAHHSGTYFENCNIKDPKNLRIMHDSQALQLFGNDTMHLIENKIRLANMDDSVYHTKLTKQASRPF